MTAEMMYPVSADATSDPPHPVGQQICRDDHPGEAQQYEQVKRHVTTSFAVTRSTERQRNPASQHLTFQADSASTPSAVPAWSASVTAARSCCRDTRVPGSASSTKRP